MIVFFLFVACMASACGYALGILIMAALGNPIAKAIVWVSVVFIVVVMLILSSL